MIAGKACINNQQLNRMKRSILFLLLSAGIFLLPFKHALGQASEPIRLTSVPDWGNTSENLYGKVNVNPLAYKVAGLIFIEEAGGWWTKPSFANPAVTIAADSSFVLDFTGGGMDRYCTRLLAVLVPNGYQVPVFGGVGELPEDFLSHPYAIVARPHGDRKLDWAGVTWTVKKTVDNIAMSPGPNLFNSAENNVFIDDDDCLHLKINNDLMGHWLCSELIADTSFGFGTYTFNLKSRVDNFDLNTVLGIFTWDDIAPYSAQMPEDFYREYDFEFSYWSILGNDVGQFVIQPWDYPGNIFRFPIGPETNTIHRMTWKKDVIEFISMREDNSVIAQFEYDGIHYKDPGTENIRINLWLVFGQAPQAGQEAILSGFHFEPILAAPINVSATDGSPQKVTVTWDDQPGKYFGIYRGIADDPMGAALLTDEWITEPVFDDYTGQKGTTYHYWVRSSDNSKGSNSTGYASGFSDYDTGWFVDTNMFISDREDEIMLLISPNPCDEYAIVKSKDKSLYGSLRLFDAMGRLVLEQPFVTEALLPTAWLFPGLYYLHLIPRTGNACAARFVVWH